MCRAENASASQHTVQRGGDAGLQVQIAKLFEFYQSAESNQFFLQAWIICANPFCILEDEVRLISAVLHDVRVQIDQHFLSHSPMLNVRPNTGYSRFLQNSPG